jgi:periplasmic copper chaperone A
MPFKPRHFTIALLLLSACGASAQELSAQQFKAGDIVVSNPWSRATPKGAKVGAGYMVIENRGAIPDRLVGGSVKAAAGFEIHDTVVEDGVMRMRQLAALELPPGESVEVKPGGRHIMFVDLDYPLTAGQKTKGELRFERAGRLEIEFDVIGMGAPPPGGRKD